MNNISLRNLYLIFLGFFSQIAFTQTEGTSYINTGRGGTATTFATDYQALGINPANIDSFAKHTSLTLGIGETNISFYSEALKKTDVRNMLFGRKNPITSQEAEELGQSFAEEGMTVNYDMRAFGLGFKIGKAGALAFAVDLHASHYSILGEQASSLIFEGYNYANYFDTIVFTPQDTFGVANNPVSFYQLAKGTRIKGSADMTFNTGWGMQVYENEFIKVRLGIGAKYVLSYAYYDLNANENFLGGYTAISNNPFDLTTTQTPSQIYNNYKPVGKGLGFDLGANITLFKDLDVGISVVNIGTMNYTANLISFNDFVLDTVSFSGLDNTNPVDMMYDIVNEENLIQYNGIEKISVSMPTTLRLGIGYRIFNNLQLGADLVMPLVEVANSYPEPYFGLGAELRVLKILKISSGIAVGGGYKSAIPFGLGLDFGIWEIGVASRDVTTWFGQSSPYVSAAAGLLRFRL
ncbi:MAG: hypothetical protein KBF51_11095 [Chitinophagales bacterium]|nr:hypothetical protein [Chitinophagales bacterium]MBP9190080.1 hypothetical protein [Chitinophagales bacterium]